MAIPIPTPRRLSFVNLSDLKNKGFNGINPFKKDKEGKEPLKIENAINRETRAAVRGMLVPKDYINENSIFFFQFNPSTIRDSKGSNWLNEEYLGFSAPEPFWVSGQARTIDFELFVDATAESLGKAFGGSSVDYDTIRDVPEVFPRGVMDYIEKLQSFQYPISDENPRFIGNVAVPSARFEAPPILIFVFGEFYMDCALTDLKISYELFDADLIPRRARCQITLTIYEMEKIRVDGNIPKRYLTVNQQ